MKINKLLLVLCVFACAGCNNGGGQEKKEEQEYKEPGGDEAIVNNGFKHEFIADDEMPLLGFCPPSRQKDTNYGVPGYQSLADYKQYKDLGFNMVYPMYERENFEPQIVMNAMDICDELGLCYLVGDTTYAAAPSSKMTEEDYYNRMVNDNWYADHKCFVGLASVDEPNATLFSQLGLAKKAFDRVYPDKLHYSNLFPCGATNAQMQIGDKGNGYTLETYTEYVSRYLEAVPASVLAYDQYLWHNDDYGQSDGCTYHFTTLSLYRNFANKYNLPLWACLAGSKTATIGNPPYTTEQLDYNINSYLLYGVKGLQWYTYFPPYDNIEKDTDYSKDHFSLVSGYGSPLDNYYRLQRALKNVKTVDELLMPSVHKGIMQFGERVSDIKRCDILKEYGALKEITGGNALVGCFDYKGHNLYYVMNDSIDDGKTSTKGIVEFTAKFNNKADIRLVNYKLGDNITRDVDEVKFGLAGGEAVVIEVLKQGEEVKKVERYEGPEGYKTYKTVEPTNGDVKIAEENAIEGQKLPENHLTTNDWPNLSVYGETRAYDDVIQYKNNDNGLRYFCSLLDDSQLNSVFDFDLELISINPDNYFSFVLRSDSYYGHDGYKIVIHPRGAMEVYKGEEYNLLLSTTTPVFELGKKYHFEVSAIYNNGVMHLSVKVDGTSILELDDASNPLLNGNYFVVISNIYGEPFVPIEFNLYPTVKNEMPNYKTYTFSSFRKHPQMQGNPLFETGTNNFSMGGDIVGFYLDDGRCSMEFNVNFDNVHENCALNLAIRSELFGPAFGGSLNSYKTQIGANVAYLWKGDDLIGMFPTPISFKKNIDYVIEFGAVDVDENETDVFLKINGETMFNVFDKNNPLQHAGYFLLTCQGSGAYCNFKSADDHLNIIKEKQLDTQEYYLREIYFDKPISNKLDSIDEFSNRNLDAICINDICIRDFLNLYTKYGDAPVELSMSGNVLSIKIFKSLLDNKSNPVQFGLEKLSIIREHTITGFSVSDSYHLANNYCFTY